MAIDAQELIQGNYFDGHSSKAYPAFIHFDEDGIHILPKILGDFRRISLAPNEVRIDSKIGTAPRVLRFGEGASFTCPQHLLIDKLAKIQNNKAGFLHYMESRLHIALLALVLSVAAIYGITVYGVPFTAKTLAFHLPEATFLEDESVLSVLDKTLFDPSELPDDKQTEVRQLLAPYLDAYQHLQPNIHFRKMGQPNALALMSGDIIFTDEFIQLTKNDDELLAVFFHEVGHLKHKHFLRRLIQDTLISMLVVFILGDIEMPDLIAGAPTLLLDLSYSRDFEKEADQFALEQMAYFDVPINAFTQILTQLTSASTQTCSHPEHHQADKEANDGSYLRSHPSTPERVAAIERFIKNNQRLAKKENPEGLTAK
ncbi:MAG: M48 family metallopeptidase [Cellvibrionales bacterium]|nr:M48 family metallopeptidase [Cellvibrionales bacterium]